MAENSLLSSSIEERTKYLAKCVKSVTQKFETNPLYSLYIYFKLNDFEIDSTSTDRLKNLAMSLNFKCNGSGAANSFTLQITYSPDISGGNHINVVDESILQIVKGEASYTSLFCYLQFGYGDETDSVYRSPKYECLLTNYDCEIQNGMLSYTFQGYSLLAVARESKDSMEINVDSEGKCKPTLAVEYIVTNYMQKYSENQIGELNYKLTFDSGVRGSDESVPLTTVVDKSPSAALTSILSYAIHHDEYDKYQNGELEPYEITKYNWYIIDAPEDDYDGIIYVTMDKPSKARDVRVAPELVFNWMTPGKSGEANHLVISFKPQFSGSVLLARSAATKDGNSMSTNYFIDDSGKLDVASTPSQGASTIGGNKEAVVMNTKSEVSSWLAGVQYPYEATLITMGIPSDIPVCGYIKVVPMIYGVPHSSAGVYQILSSEHNLSSNGFTTTWKLIRAMTE